MAREELCNETFVANFGKGKPVEPDGVDFGTLFRADTPEVEFKGEIVWAYEQARAEYQNALALDSTDTRSYIELARVLRQFGEEDEVTFRLCEPLSVLNKALQADDSDKESYLETSEVFDELGESDLAITDLQQVLRLTTSEYEIQSVTKRIESLRQIRRSISD